MTARDKTSGKDQSPASILMREHLELIFGCTPNAEYRFSEGRRWRFDFAILSLMLACEIEGGIWTGGRHTRGKGFQNDLDKYASAACLGWTVFRFSVEDVLKARDIDYLIVWNHLRKERQSKNIQSRTSPQGQRPVFDQRCDP